MKTPTLLHWITALTSLNYFCMSADGASQTALVKELMANYNKDVRPSFNSSEPTKLTVDIALTKILLVEEKEEAITTNIWLRLHWEDPRLAWNITKFGDVGIITMNSQNIWVPDIDLLNRAPGSDIVKNSKTRVRATPKGSVQWLIPIILRSSCSIDITYFPFDDQLCPVMFGSWSLNKEKLKVVPKRSTVVSDYYTPNGEWTLLSVKSKEETRKHYDSENGYSVVSFDISIRRETLYYMMNFIVPCVLIAILIVPVLLLPPESQERQSYGVTVLLSFTILIMMLQEKVPATSRVYPMIAIYYACTIVQVSLAMIMSTGMLCFYHKRPCTTPIPKLVKVVILKWCAKLVLMQGSVEKIKQKLYSNTWKQFAIRKSRSTSGGIKEVTEGIFSKQEECIRQEEWRIAAYVLNRFFTWMYSITIFLTFFIVFFNAPRAKEGTL